MATLPLILKILWNSNIIPSEMQSSVARAQNTCKAIEMLSVLGEKKEHLNPGTQSY